MKKVFIMTAACSIVVMTACTQSSSSRPQKQPQLFIDVHHLGAGQVTVAAVAEVHKKDLAVQQKFNVSFLKYWVDTVKGDVYCLSSAMNPEAISNTHAAAHGLMPSQTYLVTDGAAAERLTNRNYYLDIHDLGAGNVTAAAVAEAHKKDILVESKYGVNFINYWVNEKEGKIFCLSQAPDSNSVIKTHKEAHGLLPKSISLVAEGQ